MDVFRLHIEVNQRLQEVASFKRDKYKPEEIDMALNKAMFRLLEKGVETRFQNDQINLSHVAALIKKNKIEDVIIPATNDPIFEQNILSGYSVIPADLYWAINTRVEAVSDLVNCDIAPTLTLTTKPEYITIVAFPPADLTAPYYANPSVSSSIVGSMYSLTLPGFNSVNSKYVIRENITEFFYKGFPGVQCYWERYRDVYYKDKFIFVGSLNLGTVTITLGGQATTGNSTLTTYPIYDRTLISSIPNVAVNIETSVVQQEDSLYDALKTNKYYAPSKNRIVVDQTYDYFIIYRGESFIVTRLYFDYIRKPRTISLLLGQNCELADSTHPKIVDLAVEILRLDTKDQNYPQTVQDTELRNN